MMRRAIIVVAAALVGCSSNADPGGSAGSGADTDGTGSSGGSTWASSWGTTEDTTPWNVDTENPPAPPPPPGTEGEEETEDFESEGGEEEDFVGWFGFGPVEPGVSMNGEGEVVVFVDEEDLCLLAWTIDSATPDETCEACEFAFTVTMSEEVYAEAEEDCSLAGIDAAGLAGYTVGLGFAGETVFVDEGSGYVAQPHSYFEWDVDSGEYEWELPIEK